MNAEIIAVVIGVGALVAIIIASMMSGRTRRHREGGDRPIIPIGRLGDDNDDVGLS